jgi:hypothetical protein
MIMLDTYTGKGLEPDRAEALALNKVSLDLLEREAELYRAKWFDYRRLHHSEATLLFAELYRQASKRAHAKYFDRDEAENVRAYKGANVFALGKGEITGFWKARQHADFYGIPYGWFCSFAIDAWLRKMAWKYLPRPNQLYSDEVRDEITEKWVSIKQTRLFRAETDFYRLTSYTGHPDQEAYIDWLIGQVAQRSNPEFALSGLIGIDIPEDRAINYFGHDRVNHAHLLAQ